MKNRIVHNWELKLLAILFSVVIWLVVVNIDDPVKFVQFSDIEVEILNEDALTERGEVYEVLEETNVIDVTIKGRRSIIEDISKENIRATADMLDLTSMDTLTIKLSTNKYANEIDDIKCSTENVKLSIEELKKVQRVIEIKTEGTPAENYMLGDLSTNLNQVYLEGPESSIDRVASVKAVLDVEGVSSNISSSVPLSLFDSEGNLIEDSRIKKNINTVSISQTVLTVKEIPLKFEVSGTPQEGYALTGNVKANVETVLVAGSRIAVESIGTLTISGSQLDVTDRKSDLTARIDLDDYLPANLILADKNYAGIVNVTVEINRETFITAVISETDFNIVNVPAGMNAEYTINPSFVNEEEIELKLIGLAERLEDINVDTLKGEIDLKAYMEEQELTELKAGTYIITPNFNLPPGVRVQPEIKVTVHVTTE